MSITRSLPFRVDVHLAWVPPYPVPIADGEVVPIAGDAEFGSLYPTNVENDVRPAECPGTSMITSGDSGMQYIASFSAGGAVVSAGSGGHHGQMGLGAMLFDLADARWKRIWTTNGEPGDNITTELVDIRRGTRVHNCLHYFGDVRELYGTDDGHGPCWNPEHWRPSSTQLEYNPRAADPRDQTWEITRREPYPYGPVRIPATGNPIIEGPHGWPHPGEWAGLCGFPRTGYVGRSARFDPSPVGTHAPTQSGLPAPGHCWYMYFEVSPADGGGSRGSIAFARSTYQGYSTSSNLSMSHRFDLETGIWHEYSVNNSAVSGNDSPPGDTPWHLDGATAACVDPVQQRVYLAAQHASSTTRLNYMNFSDRTWRNMTIGEGTPEWGRTESLSCDPDRRLLIMHGGTAPNIRIFDLATVGPEPTPTGGTGGWRPINLEIAPGFEEAWYGIEQAPLDDPTAVITAGGASRKFGTAWKYYPPNGNFYRVTLASPLRCAQSTHEHERYRATTGSEYWGIAPGELGPYAGWRQPMGSHDKISRLRPPPVGADYFNDPWVFDEITLSMPMARGAWHSVYAACGANRFYYVPALECFVYLPLNHGSGERPETRNPVYLFKPY
jgi:hypothetical protein